MELHELKLVETTINFLQFMTSIYLIIITASGAAFYYYWTKKLNGGKLKDLWPFGLPAAIVLGSFIFIGYIYSKLINALAEGILSSYMLFWFRGIGVFLWVVLFFGVSSLIFAFIKVHRRL